jgi:hypothetical protein
MQELTRHEAARRGMTRYYTGRPCLRGHVAERYVSSGQCCQCRLEQAREDYQAIREMRRQAGEGATDG